MPDTSDRKKKPTFKRHPAAIAQDVYDEKYPATFDPTTLLAPEDQRQYLTNRIHRAFHSGWDAAMKHKEPTPGPLATETEKRFAIGYGRT